MAGKNENSVNVTVKPEKSFHKKIKAYCFKKNISMNDYFLELAERDFKRRAANAKKGNAISTKETNEEIE